MISASIVLYNTDKDLLKSVLESYHPNQERLLLIIDNSPTPTDYFVNMKNVHYIFNGKNIGFGAAHNIAIHEAIKLKSEYHIVLNPDIEFDTAIIAELKHYCDEYPDVSYVLPKVIYPNGDLQYLCKLLPTPTDLIFRRFIPHFGHHNTHNDRYTLKDSGYNKIFNPPCLSGCFMFLRVSTLDQYQLFFDDRFFMYCEDFDLIRRIHRVAKTIFYPYVTIVHNHAASSYHDIKMLLIHISSACKYFNKYGWFFDKERDDFNQRVLSELGLEKEKK